MHLLAFEAQPTAVAGGQERSLFDTLQFAARNGAAVSLCYESWGDLVPGYREFASEVFELKSRRVTRKVVRFVWDVIRLVVKAGRRRWTLLYSNQYFDAVIAVVVSRLTGIPAVCHLRLACPDYLSRQYRWALTRCARLIANSNFTKESYVRAGIPADHITVVHNGVDTVRFTSGHLNRDVGPVRVVYLGRLCPTKGITTLIDAVAKARSASDQFELRVVGNVRSHLVGAEYLDVLKDRAGKELNKTVWFEPHVVDIRPILWDADVVVVPSLCEEAFGKVVIEAMAAEVPVIASAVGGIPEILWPGFASHLVQPGDVDALAATLSRIGRWRATDPTLGARSRQWVQDRFSVEARLSELCDCLLAVNNSRPSRAEC